MSRFVYVTYIRTTPARLWQALTDPAFVKRYWFDSWQECDWNVGSPWRIVREDGSTADSGEVLEAQPGKRLVLSWRNEFKPELTAEGFGRMTYDIEDQDGVVKLTVTHEMDVEDSKLITAVSGGWPSILASLKSLLETGKALGEGV
jgi:uncharacterized protein YndB with AHSA1/START domain